MKFITTYNTENMKLIHGDFVKSDSWVEIIMEDGSFSRDCQYMTFDYNGIEISVSFELSVSGNYSYDPGDYWTPPCDDCDITEIQIEVNSLTIDEEEVEINLETIEVLRKVINKNL